MILTAHAQARWAERFPHLDPVKEWNESTPSGRKSRKRIAELCKAHRSCSTGVFKGFYYRLSRHQVVFVCVPGEKIVTVFEYTPKES